MKTVLTAWKLTLLLLMGSLVIEAEHSVPDAPRPQRRIHVWACKGDRKGHQRLLAKGKNHSLRAQLLKSGQFNFIFGFGLYVKNCLYLLINLFSSSKHIHLMSLYSYLSFCPPTLLTPCLPLLPRTLDHRN